MQETYDWYPLKDCIPLLEKNRYACFSDPSHSSDAIKKNSIPEIEQKDLTDILMVYSARGMLSSQPLSDMVRRLTRGCN
jgi:arginine-tRNA-protein transferase